MSEIQFEEEQYSSPTSQYQERKTGDITNMIIRLGLAKDTRTANYVMIGFIMILAVIFFIAINVGGNNDENIPVPEDYTTVI